MQKTTPKTICSEFGMIFDSSGGSLEGRGGSIFREKGVRDIGIFRLFAGSCSLGVLVPFFMDFD